MAGQGRDVTDVIGTEMAAMTDRLVREAIDILRAEAQENEVAARVYRVCDEAADAAARCREKVIRIREEWMS